MDDDNEFSNFRCGDLYVDHAASSQEVLERWLLSFQLMLLALFISVSPLEGACVCP